MPQNVPHDNDGLGRERGGSRHHAVRAQPRCAHLRRQPRLRVTDEYASPFKFTGTIHSVTVDVSGKLIEDTEAELRMHMARQ